MLHKIAAFWQLKNGKWIFCARESKSSFGNIICHPKVHPCAQYGRIITNYALVLVLQLLICVARRESSYMEAHFCEHYFRIIAIIIFFIPLQLGHIDKVRRVCIFLIFF